MIEEAYVSFETAKLLKEKEFDEPCYSYYTDDTHKFIQSWSMHPIMNKTNPCFFGIAAPTQQMAMRWLREIYHIYIIPFVIDNGIITARIATFDLDGRKQDIIHNKLYNSYEECLDEVIKYCLENLI